MPLLYLLEWIRTHTCIICPFKLSFLMYSSQLPAFSCNCNWGTCIVPPTRRRRVHHRVNLYLGAHRQNETKMFSDHDKTSPSITAQLPLSVFTLFPRHPEWELTKICFAMVHSYTGKLSKLTRTGEPRCQAFETHAYIALQH